jgi:acetylornithine deacetylase/succinyl-diaminopimelate desuccinylase-like protein
VLPGAWGIDPQAADDTQQESVGLLQRLIQADTSNPPGDDSPAAQVIQEHFGANGIDLTVVGESPALPNCVARLAGTGGGPTLLLLGHLDVVPAIASEWTEPPFSGEVKGGYVWGRGALDMKSQLAAQAVAFVRLARRARAGGRLRGDLIYAATADEETGEHCGAKWLLENALDLVRTDYVVNEGAMDRFTFAGRPSYALDVGEKGYANCRITIHGRPGHGSVPMRRDNAVGGLARVIDALGRYHPEVHGAHVPLEFIDRAVASPGLRARLRDPVTAQAAVRELALRDRAAAALIEPALGLTLSPTLVRAGEDAVNVIPSAAEVVVDCRVLPGQSIEDVQREIAQALSEVDAQWDLEVFAFTAGNASPASSPLHDAIAATMADLVPGAGLVDTILPAFTDCVHFRSALPDVVAYGFSPLIQETGAEVRGRLHGIDERIAVRDLVFQTEFFERLAVRLLG